MRSKQLVIIPARMGSSRFPGKPLFEIAGMPMIQHCISNAEKAVGRDFTWVATCDEEIFDFVKSIGSNVVMTSDKHDRATDRTAEAASIVENDFAEEFDIIAMLQGDEPLISASMIKKSVEVLHRNPEIFVSNLMCDIVSLEEFRNPNTVKVVCDANNFALYFSREPIPSLWKLPDEAIMRKQVCIIPFRREFLATFNALCETPLERLESIDMMRALENGYRVKMVETTNEVQAVDTLQDAEIVEEIIKKLL